MQPGQGAAAPSPRGRLRRLCQCSTASTLLDKTLAEASKPQQANCN